jgi:hypothetical protein
MPPVHPAVAVTTTAVGHCGCRGGAGAVVIGQHYAIGAVTVAVIRSTPSTHACRQPTKHAACSGEAFCAEHEVFNVGIWWCVAAAERIVTVEGFWSIVGVDDNVLGRAGVL